jgi:hypothetical protein
MKNKNAQALGRLGAAKSPRSDAWREMAPDELAEIGRKGATARWAKLTEAERKKQMDKVRAGRVKK